MHALRELLIAKAPQATLDVAALDAARIECPNLDAVHWLRELDRMAMEVAGRVDDLSEGAQFVHALNEYLFSELGFHGNETDYYDPRNSCLNDVLAYRTGIPISLSIVYLEVSRRLAQPVYGIGAPGHFMVQFDNGRLNAFIDPFHRRCVMNREQCLTTLSEYNGTVVGEEALVRFSPKQIAIRMLRNLEGAYIRLNRFDKALLVADLLRLGEGTAGPRLPKLPDASN